MKNLVQAGNTIDFTAPTGGLSAGDVAALRSGTDGMIGVAVTDIAAGASGAVQTEGVFELAADNTTAFDQGDTLYWDADDGELTKTATGNTLAGTCWAAKAEAGALASVKLRGV